MLVTAAERAYLTRAEAVEALLAHLRYLDEDEAEELGVALNPPNPEAADALAAAWALAGYADRLEEAELSERCVRAFLGSARRFPWSAGNALWPTSDAWRAIKDRAVAHGLALVTNDLLDREHFDLLYDRALVTDWN